MAISIIVNVFLKLFQYIGLPILIFYGTIILLKVLYEYFSYGPAIFSSFKTKDISHTRDELLFIGLDKIMWYRKIIKNPNFESNYILVDGNGITLFKIFTCVGCFVGNEHSKFLYYRGSKDERRLINPLYLMDKDEKKIKTKFKNIKVNKCLVITEGTHIAFPADASIVNFKKIPYNLSEGYLYPEEEIKKMAEKIETM